MGQGRVGQGGAVGAGRYVAVVGPGSGATDRDCEVAAEVGRLLADHGFVVVCGGLDAGVMAAVAAGSTGGGGVSVGLLPGPDRRGAADGLTVALPTGVGQARNALVVNAADAVIAVGGSWGTFSEVSLAMRAGRPVVTVGGWRAVDGAGAAMGPAPVRSAAEAVTWVIKELGLARVAD